VDLKIMEATSPQDVNLELARQDYHIFHFFGHAGVDPEESEGYLVFDIGGGADPKKYPASALGSMLRERGIRLAFLNACETAVADPGSDPARKALAQTLLANGIPAVIATQFLMPDNSAHSFAESVYNALVAGHSVVSAMREGREAMNFAPDPRQPDWGIPVLYSFSPGLVLFPRATSPRLAKASKVAVAGGPQS
jgi:CHAT domain-containing protein